MDKSIPPKNNTIASVHVGTVVQEYMDSLLVDLFPDVVNEKGTPSDNANEALDTSAALDTTPIKSPVQTESASVPPIAVTPEPETQEPPINKAKQAPEKSATLSDTSDDISVKTENTETQTNETDNQVTDKPAAEPLRYPNAPEWAQQTFEILLFDVCGLKLAVPMEALGKIIKTDHETNQLIGRPDWFIGAYTENEQHLSVVDTAQYIMPEKGFNLAQDGFDYIIQLQRSHWALACKTVHSTVSLEPDQVKWRTQKGKRQWLSGTVVEHMCALVHVDSLIALLDAQVK